MTSVSTKLDILEALKIPEIRKIFLETMQGIVDNVILKDIIKAVEANDIEAVVKAVGLNQAVLFPIVEAINDAYKQAGYTVSASFPSKITGPDGSRFTFTFDMRNPAVEQYLRDSSSAMVTRLNNEARENVRMTLERGMVAGANPKTTALAIVGRIDPITKQRIGGVIGLTVAQETWAANAKANLQNLDKKYLNRELRDKRFDSVVKKAIESGTPLPEETVSKIMTSYNNRLLKYRADMIARTEIIHAINAADYATHKQLIAEGGVKESAVRREWDDVGDSRVRWSHKIMAKKYGKGKGVSVDEPFISPSGAKMMYPGDTSLGADGDETIGCRCRARVRVDWIGNLLK